MINAKPMTVDDIYMFDDYINTPGVREGLLARGLAGGEEFVTEDTDDGPAIFYRAPHGEMIGLGLRPVVQSQEPSLEGLQLAAGPSQTRTDAPQGYGATGEAKAVDPTNRERLAGFLTDSLVNLGADRYKARERVDSFIGGTSSRLPLNLGLADFVPFLGTFLQSEEAAILLGKSKEAAERGDIKTAAIEGVGGAIGLIPGAAATVKYGKKALQKLPEAAESLGPTINQMAEDYLRKTGATMAVAPESVAKQVTDPMPRVDSIQRFPVGPASIKPKVIASDMPLYREMNVDNLTDFLRNDSQFAYSPAFVTDNPDLAIGQGANKGVKVTFRANSISGEEHAKPMAGAMAGREYKADVVAPRAIESITFASESDLKKVKSLAASVLKKEFERVADNGGNITFVRKMQPQEKK